MDFSEIVGLILACILILMLIGLFVFIIMYTFVHDSIRREFIESLNEHDRAIISSFVYRRPSYAEFKKHFSRKDN